MYYKTFLLGLSSNIGNFILELEHTKTTAVAVGAYFENFIHTAIQFKRASEVVRAGLRMLEEKERRIMEFKSTIEEGERSGIAEYFNPEKTFSQ